MQCHFLSFSENTTETGVREKPFGNTAGSAAASGNQRGDK